MLCGWRRQVLPAYWFGDWHWASAHVLCLAGAVLGSMGSFAWQAHANSVTEGGAPTWLVSQPVHSLPKSWLESWRRPSVSCTCTSSG